MLSIIRTELFRLKKSKLFWILLGLCVALPAISLVLTLALAKIIEAIFADTPEMGSMLELIRNMDLTNLALTDFPSLLNDAGFLALISSSVILSKEFTDGTMRNVILANKSRKQMFFAYLLTAMIIGATYLTAYFATIMILYAPIYGFGSSTAAQAVSACFCSYALGLTVICFVSSCVCMFLFCTRKQWATVLLPILICMFAPQIITLIVNLISALVASRGEMVTEYDLQWIPFVNAQLYDPAHLNGGLVGMISLYYMVFAAAFTAIGFALFDKADLK